MLSIEALAARRPILYHLTAAINVPRIKKHGRLYPANQLFKEAGATHLYKVRRRIHERIAIAGETILIRDQAPLHKGNVSLKSGWEFEDFVHVLNQHVFFWPGTETAPIAYGIRHFQRYQNEDVRILRIPLVDLIAQNQDCPLLVCKYNSGSPRCNGGLPSPRGNDTFLPLHQSSLRPSQIVEITFNSEVQLPASTTVAHTLDGRWRKLL